MDGDSFEKLTLEEQLCYLHTLLDSVIWGPLLEHPSHRAAIAQSLYTKLEAGAPKDAFQPAVQAALYRTADALAEIDSQPDSLKPVLRPFVKPGDSGADS